MIETVTKGFETTLVVSLPTSRGHYIKDKIFALIAFLITSFTVLFYFFHQPSVRCDRVMRKDLPATHASVTKQDSKC